MTFKKLFLVTALSALVSNAAWAITGTAYVYPGLVLTQLTSKTANFAGISPRIDIGYGGYLAPNFFLAGEIFGTPGGATIVNNVSRDVGGQSVKATWGYGASLIPSMYLNKETLGFLRIGVLTSHFDSTNQTDPGGQIGIGLGTELGEDVNLTAEYDYAFYRSMKGIGSPKADMYTIGVVKKLSF